MKGFDQPIVLRKQISADQNDHDNDAEGKNNDGNENENKNKKRYKSKNGTYMFNLETHEMLSSSIRNNPMSGIMFLPFLKLLFHKRKSIDWYRYKHRLTALFFMSILNSFLSLVENFYLAYLYCSPTTREAFRTVDAAIDHDHGDQHPVFVLGHPRTGTTLLHSLLAFDEERFCISDTFMVGFPHCFLWFERMGKFLFKDILSETRPMDNMKLHFDLPQEDELGTNLLAGCTVSPYNSLFFMRDEREYRKYQCFLDEEIDDGDLQQWSKAFLSFIRKVKLRDVLKMKMKMRRRMGGRDSNSSSNRPRQLVLKSPCHTGRVKLLLKLFPNAKFVFIHRNPYEVFLSGAHLATTTYGWMFLQKPDDEDMQEYILKQGEILHNEYFSCRGIGNVLHGNVSSTGWLAD